MGKKLREQQIDVILQNSVSNVEKNSKIEYIYLYNNVYWDQVEVLLIPPIPVQIRDTSVVEKSLEWESRKKG